jgi:uncharacterized lipoprotein YmbA
MTDINGLAYNTINAQWNNVKNPNWASSLADRVADRASARLETKANVMSHKARNWFIIVTVLLIILIILVTAVLVHNYRKKSQ